MPEAIIICEKCKSWWPGRVEKAPGNLWHVYEDEFCFECGNDEEFEIRIGGW